MYELFKRYYSFLCDSWLISNPGKTLSIYDVAELSGQAFQRSFTIENKNSSFKSTEIFSYNSYIFTDVFLPFLVTDILLQQNNVGDKSPCFLSTCGLFAASTSTLTLEVDDYNLLETTSLYPKAEITRKRPNQKRCKSATITHTQEKKYCFSLQKATGKNSKQKCFIHQQNDIFSLRKITGQTPNRKKLVSSSSESDMSIKLPSDSFSKYESNISGMSKNLDSAAVTAKNKLQTVDFAIIKVFLSKGKIAHKNFIRKICYGPDDNGDYVVNFIRRSEKIKHGFQFPEDEDTASVELNDIV